MVGEGDESQFGTPLLHLYDTVAVVFTIKLHTGIAHLADGLEGAVEVLFEVGTYAVELNTYGENTLKSCTLQSLAATLIFTLDFPAAALIFALAGFTAILSIGLAFLTAALVGFAFFCLAAAFVGFAFLVTLVGTSRQ
jgi:voltage-gated potassium channel Kch